MLELGTGQCTCHCWCLCIANFFEPNTLVTRVFHQRICNIFRTYSHFCLMPPLGPVRRMFPARYNQPVQNLFGGPRSAPLSLTVSNATPALMPGTFPYSPSDFASIQLGTPVLRSRQPCIFQQFLAVSLLLCVDLSRYGRLPKWRHSN